MIHALGVLLRIGGEHHRGDLRLAGRAHVDCILDFDGVCMYNTAAILLAILGARAVGIHPQSSSCAFVSESGIQC